MRTEASHQHIQMKTRLTKELGDLMQSHVNQGMNQNLHSHEPRWQVKNTSDQSSKKASIQSSDVISPIKSKMKILRSKLQSSVL